MINVISIKSENYKEISSSLRKYPLAISTLVNDIEGAIFVDDADDPQKGILVNKNKWLYSFGELSDKDMGMVTAELDKIIASDSDVAVWFGIDVSSYDYLERETDYQLMNCPRYTFEYTYKTLPEVNLNYEVIEMDSHLIHNNKAIRDVILDYWNDIDTFIKHGFGLAMHDGDENVCIILSASNDGHEVEINIETNPKYRGCGNAFNISKVFIDRCVEKGLTPKWDCLVSNVASQKLAAKLGFHKVSSYDVGLVKRR